VRLTVTQLEAWHRAYDAALEHGDDHEGAIRDADWAAGTAGRHRGYGSAPRYWPDVDEAGVPIPWAYEVNRQNRSQVAS
jgi:hypothetical protein